MADSKPSEDGTTGESGEPAPRARWARRLRRWAVDVGIVVVAYFLLSAWIERNLLDDGRAAPAFDLHDLQGRSVSLEALRGRRVLVHFWATWCGVCRQEIGALNAVHAALDDDERLVAIVADGEDPERIRRFVREHDIRYPVLLGDDAVIAAYRVDAFPTNYFVDPDGRITDSTRGMSTRWGMATRLERAE